MQLSFPWNSTKAVALHLHLERCSFARHSVSGLGVCNIVDMYPSGDEIELSVFIY